MTAAYSAFFSSGLLAPQHAFINHPNSSVTSINDPNYDYFDLPSPISPSSPVPISDDSDIELDTEREQTPTPDAPSLSTNASATGPNSNATTSGATSPSTAVAQPRPRLRKRRSSLTVGTSPMNSIRSPARSAGNALQLQMHLTASPPASLSRSRSGSLSAVMNLASMGAVAEQAQAQQATSPAAANALTSTSQAFGPGTAPLAQATNTVIGEKKGPLGRLRSGSVGGFLSRPRRGPRRLVSVPAPTAPPPTAPLPALPTFVLSPGSASKFTSAPLSAPLAGSFQVPSRPPLVSRSSSGLISTVNTVAKNLAKQRDVGHELNDDAMKEN